MPYKKFAKKVVKKVKEVTGNRYGRGAKQLLIKGVPQLTKDVLMMKKMLNAEKKRSNLAGSYYLGQLNHNDSAFIAQDITPTPSQGATSSTRNGASIKLNSGFLKFQIYHMSSTTQPVKLRIMIAKVTGTPESNMNTFFKNCWSSNQFLTGGTIYDYHSQPNPDYFRAYKLIRTKTITIPADQISGVNMIKDISIPLKFKDHHVRFSADSQTVTNGQLIMWVVADCGNISSGSASTVVPIAVSGTNTGLVLNHAFTWYYYDN